MNNDQGMVSWAYGTPLALFVLWACIGCEAPRRFAELSSEPEAASAEAADTSEAVETSESVETSEAAETPRVEGIPVKSVPYRWTTGGTWQYRLLWVDRDRMHASFEGKVGGPENYMNALETGAAHRLEFGTPLCIVEVIPGFKWWATEYRVLVLGGQLKGTEGWVDFETLNAGANPGIRTPTPGCEAPT